MKSKTCFLLCIFQIASCLQLCTFALHLHFTIASKAKDPAWLHVQMIDGIMHCKYCLKKICGGIHKLKQHLAGIRGQITACDAPLSVIGDIREEMLAKFEKFEEEKMKRKEIQAEIGRKRNIC